jgi:transposase
MPQNFIRCDRDQVLLMPPSLQDWVPEDHLVWTIVGAVEGMNLDAFYGAYRADGHGRPAYEPSMMVTLMLYAYARGNRSSRGIERACVEDVIYRFVTANQVPDHSTIAEFRNRHEAALAGLFTDALALCAGAGLVDVGVIAVDGTKVGASASHHATHDYEQIAKRSWPRLTGSNVRRTSGTSSGVAMSCLSSCARGRGVARRWRRPSAGLSATGKSSRLARTCRGRCRPVCGSSLMRR